MSYIEIILLSLAFLFFLISFICFYITFYSNVKIDTKSQAIKLPNDPIYQRHKTEIINDITFARLMPHKDYEITSYDGLKLVGRYYERVYY